MKKPLIFLALTASALAQSSADYALTTTVFDSTGGAQGSADYAQQTTLGGILGTSADATPSIARAGFSGQLYEPLELQVLPVIALMAEGGERQFGATLLCDDSTTFTPPATDVAWSTPSSSVASVSSSGLVTAAYVYQDSTARLGASYGGIASLLDITIQNTGDDNFRPYHGDGLSDVWQVGWFGENNLAGRADMDPDGDGQDNAFEFLSGYSPLDGTALFKTRALSWDGAVFQMEISRLRPGITYEIQSSPDLIAWTLRDKITTEEVVEPFVTSIEFADPAGFFRVHLLKSP